MAKTKFTDVLALCLQEEEEPCFYNGSNLCDLALRSVLQPGKIIGVLWWKVGLGNSMQLLDLGLKCTLGFFLWGSKGKQNFSGSKVVFVQTFLHTYFLPARISQQQMGTERF